MGSSNLIQGSLQVGLKEHTAHLQITYCLQSPNKFYAVNKLQEHPHPNIYIHLLQDCTRSRALAKGKQIHAQLILWTSEPRVLLGNILINMYAKCCTIEDAHKVFDRMVVRNLFTWTAIVVGYAQQGHGKEALHLFEKMLFEGLKPDKVIFSSILSACTSIGTLQHGKLLHASITNNGWDVDLIVGSALINMYAKCGNIREAHQVFDKMPIQNVVSWSALIAGYADHGDITEAYGCFHEMQQGNVKPNKVTFLNLLKACTYVASLDQGKRFHAYIVKAGCELDAVVGSALVGMYSKSGCPKDAYHMFSRLPLRNVCSWTAILSAHLWYENNGKYLMHFQKMELEGVVPNIVTFIAVLSECARMQVLYQGKLVHSKLLKSGCHVDVVACNVLIDMYAKCDCMNDACEIFDCMCIRDTISWNKMISGYMHEGNGEGALAFLKGMKLEHLEPDEATYINVFSGTAGMIALEQAKIIHSQFLKSGCCFQNVINNVLIDMYANCGCINHAILVFEKMQARDIVCWNTVIQSYAQYGNGNDALKIFKEVHQLGINLDSVTYLSFFMACSHACMVDQAWHYFYSMNLGSGITPTIQHYVCLANLLSHVGHIDETGDFIMSMPIGANIVMWMAFLNACKIYGSIQWSERIIESLLNSGF